MAINMGMLATIKPIEGGLLVSDQSGRRYIQDIFDWYEDVPPNKEAGAPSLTY
jgi:hypothetical protein